MAGDMLKAMGFGQNGDNRDEADTLNGGDLSNTLGKNGIGIDELM